MTKDKTYILLCEECIGENNMDIAKKMFGDRINQLFERHPCTKCGKNTPSASEFLFNASIQSGKIEWWI